MLQLKTKIVKNNHLRPMWVPHSEKGQEETPKTLIQ